MELRQLLLEEFDWEMATTRKMLERVPVEKFDWKPHDRSASLGRLAIHVATLCQFVQMLFEADFINMGDGSYKPPEIKTNAELLAAFDEISKKARGLIEKTDDAALAKTWEFKFKDKVVSSTSRAASYRRFFMNHLIHHRAQLGVFLRLNDILIPGSYGPSADEAWG